ncbi:MAG: T9SS type A sorting domain-containing protein [Flavobacterium sp. JAD_PAG50586_2]|nr:MAG: T9SS type A sorting domain-containing protein [Flavobacterium sp. JAD_PAG50586_2]
MKIKNLHEQSGLGGIMSLSTKFLVAFMLFLGLSQSATAQQVTMQMVWVGSTATTADFDILLSNTSSNGATLKFNSIIVRGNHAANLLQGGTGTITWAPLNNNTNPEWNNGTAQWPNVASCPYTAGSRLLNYGSSTAFFTSANAPTIPTGTPVNIGRFRMKVTGGTWVSNSQFGFTFATTAGVVCYINGSPTTSSILATQGTSINRIAPASQTLNAPSGSTASVLSGNATICNGTSTNLSVAITGGTPPYTVVYSNGTSNFTVSDYTSGSAFSVTPSATTTYTLVSVTDNGSNVGTGNTGSALVTVNQPTSNTTTATACDSYIWEGPLGDGNTYTTSQNGITHTSTNVAGCTHTETLNLTINQSPNAGTNGSLTICSGTTVTSSELFGQLGGLPQAGGTWSPALAGEGIYTYTVTGISPCENATATVTVTTQSQPNAGTNGVYTICSGTNITLAQLHAAITGEDEGGTWSPALGGAGIYTYTVPATSPCTTADTSVVVVSAVSCQAAQLSNCGNSPVLTSVNTRIFAGNTVTQSTKYRYRVAVSTAPTTYFYAETTYPSFRLTDVVGLFPTYGTTYNVDIQNEFLISGNTVTSAYGPMCTVTTQVVANIVVPTNQCNQTLAAINSKIYVNGVTGATMYTYRIAKASAPTTYSYIETPYSNFRLTNPPTSGNVAIEHNTLYLLAVSVTTASGASNFNGECNITTPAGPMTTIQGSQCGDDDSPYVIPTSSTKVYTGNLVSGATYTFRLEQYDGNVLVDTNYATSPINYFYTNMFTGTNSLLPATKYHVYVAINFYGEGEYDHDCVIQTPAALKNEEMISSFKAMAYPNPFANNFMIDVKSSSESAVNLKVYDMIGRLIDQRDVRVSDLETTTIGDNYPSGVYNVVVSQENSVQTVRVVKR